MIAITAEICPVGQIMNKTCLVKVFAEFIIDEDETRSVKEIIEEKFPSSNFVIMGFWLGRGVENVDMA